MSDPQRREFLVTAAGIAALATLSGSQAALAGDPSFMNNVPDPSSSGKELPTFKFELEKSEGKVIGNSYGKEATVKQLPISKGIAGVSMKLEPGAMRELHWHATAAEWAFVVEGRVRTTVIDPERLRRDQRLRARRRLVFPPRPRPHARMPRRQALPLHPDLRQRLLLRVRHLQHHRLDRPHPQATAGEELRPARSRPSTVSPRRRSISPAASVPPAEAVRRRSRAGSCRRRRTSIELLAQPPHAIFKGGREWRVDSTPLPDLQDHHRRRARPRSRRPARAALASERRRVAVRHRGHGQRHAVRLARPLPDRDAQQGDVGYIPQGYGHSIENIGDKPCRILIGFNTGLYETIDLSQWIAGNPLDVLATNFSQPAELFEKFPHQDVFIANGSGGGK